ncbi:MAG TPA: MBL fold metallo-hydrolase [Candidatus Limnocylindrales bacterium]|nr:MBL fold metallo-hydrolase [Candidatus Limnocylindrales bacterium]
MKISKHLHSCLLIEDQGIKILIDPGVFTYQENALDINTLGKLDYVLITHEHFDHLHLPLVKDLFHKFPNAQIISNSSAVELLQKEGIPASSSENEHVRLQELPHEKLWDITPPPNVLFNLFGRLTHPGDSVHVKESKEILCLPITAPWGSTTKAVEMAVSLKPKFIIPIHDYMWKEEIRKGMYERLEEYFNTEGIEFKSLETGEIIEI